MKVVTLLIVADETIFRVGLHHLLASEGGFEVKGETGSKDAVEQASTLRPDVVIVSVDAARPTCTQLIGSIRTAVPGIAIVALVREADHARLSLFMAAGVLGYVLFRSGTRELFSAIRAADNGRRFIDPGLSDEVVEMIARQATSGTKLLSQREEQVLKMLAYGHTMKEIASHLAISRKSVETYRVRTREKIGVCTRAEAVRYALDTGMMTVKRDRCDSVSFGRVPSLT